jgi:hypothetical protein
MCELGQIGSWNTYIYTASVSMPQKNYALYKVSFYHYQDCRNKILVAKLLLLYVALNKYVWILPKSENKPGMEFHSS